MFVLQREDQLDELISQWAWRYKRRRLKKIPISHSPDLSALLHRLIRCSSPSIQEVWACFHSREQSYLWIDDLLSDDSEQGIRQVQQAGKNRDLCSYWNWTAPINIHEKNWVYPLGQTSPASPDAPSLDIPSPRPLCHIGSPSGIETFTRLLHHPLEMPLSLLIKSNSQITRLLIRKQLLKLFDWQETVLIDIGERPLEILNALDSPVPPDHRMDEHLALDLVHRAIQKTLCPSDSQMTLLLCDTIPTALEAAIIHQMMESLAYRNPLFLAFEPGDHFQFRWTINEEIVETPPPSFQPTKTVSDADNVLKKISRILHSIPCPMNFRQIGGWLSPLEMQQAEQCRRDGILTEQSGQIILNHPGEWHGDPACSLEEQKTLLRQSLKTNETELCRLKLLILENDPDGIRQCLGSAEFIRQLHYQSRSLVDMLTRTEASWTERIETALLLIRLCLSMFLLTPSRSFLSHLSRKVPEHRDIRKLDEMLKQLQRYSLKELILWALEKDGTCPEPRQSCIAATLRQKGFLGLALISEAEYTPFQNKPPSPKELNTTLSSMIFRARYLDNPDLMDWIGLSCAHMQLRYGSPARAGSYLRDCLNTAGTRSLPLEESLHVCEMLEGHWKKLGQEWPEQLPGGFLPPDNKVWTYLRLLLQHRFTEAQEYYRELLPEISTADRNRGECLAGISLSHLIRLQKLIKRKDGISFRKPSSLPPWMEFVLWAVHPFFMQSLPGHSNPPEGLCELQSSERNYFFYEGQYLRFHSSQCPTTLSAEQRDLFFDTCAYFTRRGRALSPRMIELRGSLASQVLSENRASDALMIKTARVDQTPDELLRAGLGIVSLRFGPDICFMRFYRNGTTQHTVGSQAIYQGLADHFMATIPMGQEERMGPEAIRKQDNGLLTPFLVPWNSLRLLRFDTRDGLGVLAIFMAYRQDPHPCLPLHAPLKRMLSPLLDQLEQKMIQDAHKGDSPLNQIIGESPAIMILKRQIQRISQVEFTVTICGESGTGKELIARAIHALSPRRNHPFIAFNCASLPETLLEAELFGVQKGAFTDARENRAGLIEAAEGGTLFLDEIGEMPLQLQAKLLRFLQDHSIRRLGENALRKIDCRILCASHRDLKAMSDETLFREDLFYRINELSIRSPSLRERIEDLPLLLDHFLEKHHFALLEPMEKHWLALKWMNRDWPGNVRELESRVKEFITYYPHQTDFSTFEATHRSGGKLHHCRNQFERICLLNALEDNKWNRKKSAADLGISRVALFKLMRKHRLLSPQYGPEQDLLAGQ